MAYEPLPTRRSANGNLQTGQTRRAHPYEGRWRSWYSAIADTMLEYPGITDKGIAEKLNKHYGTIRLIRQTDIFRDYFASRRAEYSEAHDFALRDKATKVAEKGLDLLLEKFDKQGSQIPAALINEVTTSALDRLGYGPKSTPVQVNIDNSDRRVQTVGVTASSLEEARQCIRDAQRNRVSSQTLDLLPTPPLGPGEDEEEAAETLPGTSGDEREMS